MTVNNSLKEQDKSVESYYDEKYYTWQMHSSGVGGSLEAEKFSEYINETCDILDFGSGGGFLLETLKSRSKIGVEINAVAARDAVGRGIKTVGTLQEVPNESIDVVISNHALEHVEAPMAIARAMRDKLRLNGLIIIVVPCERYDTQYFEHNRDRHLYTWSPVNLGNLFHYAGFEIIDVRRYAHRWPPGISMIDKALGRTICNIICYFYSIARPKLTQVRLVARKRA
jgi:SAM-dependent methyltransferase